MSSLSPLLTGVRKKLDDRVKDSFATGHWGLVTNNVDLTIFGDADVDDIAESRLWLKNVTGAYRSNIQLGCEWYRITDTGETILLAEGNMMTGWVEINPQGNISISPLPDYFEDYLSTIYHTIHPRPLKEKSAENQQDNFETGASLYDGHDSLSIPLCTEKFQTSREHTTLLRNIYFSNFPKWQGQTLERWLFRRVPDLIKKQNVHGELWCVKTRINYLREAMVYDEILVTMSIQRLYKNGLTLIFDFSRIINGKQEKLASSELEVLWIIKSAKNKLHSTAMPRELTDLVLELFHKAGRHSKHKNFISHLPSQEQKLAILIETYREEMGVFREICSGDPQKDGRDERHQKFLNYLDSVSKELNIIQKGLNKVTLSKMRMDFQNVVQEFELKMFKIQPILGAFSFSPTGC